MVKQLAFLALLLGSPLLASAAPDLAPKFADQSLPETWWSRLENEYVRWWMVEQDHRLTRLEADPEFEAAKIRSVADRSALGRKEVLAVIAQIPSDCPPWMKASAMNLKAVLEGRPAKTLSEAQSRDALAHALAHQRMPLRNLSASHWRAFGTLYGFSARDRLFESAFAAKDVSTSLDRSPASYQTHDSVEIVFVEDGRATVKNYGSRPLLRPFSGFLEASDATAEAKALESQGFRVHYLKVSPLGSLNDQAVELDHALARLKETKKASKPLVIVSSGEASMVVRQWLDLKPERRRDDSYAGWVNFNGRLFGIPVAANTPDRSAQRSPASLADWEILRQFSAPQRQALQPEAPLGRGFPILNLLRLEKGAIDNPREAVVPEAETWVIRAPAQKNALSGAVKWVVGMTNR